MSPALQRMRDWQDALARFWGSYPWLFHILRTPLLWFSLAVLSAYYDFSREFTCVFVLLAVLVMVAREFIPLAPTPFGVYNVVTSRSDAYATAARMIPLFLLGMAFVGIFVVISERIGNISYHAGHDFKKSTASYWGVEPLPWLTVFIIGAPLLYFSSLTVSNRFVCPKLESMRSLPPRNSVWKNTME